MQKRNCFSRGDVLNSQGFGRRVIPSAQYTSRTLALEDGKAATSGKVDSNWPILTICLVATLIALYAAQRVLYVEHTSFLGMQNGAALGGVTRYLVLAENQWWRIVTASLLNRNIFHFVADTLAIGIAGYFVERAVGPWVLIVVFAVAGIVASLFALLVYPNIFGDTSGQAAALAVVSIILGARRLAKENAGAAVAGIFALVLPIAALYIREPRYGYLLLAPIVGGSLAGLLFALLIGDKANQGYVRVIAFCLIAMFVGAFPVNGLNYERYASLSRMMAPTAEIPFGLVKDKSVDSRVKERALLKLTKQYPRDPLPHLYLGLEYYLRRDLLTATKEFTEGLADEHILRTQHYSNVRVMLRKYLVTTYLRRHDVASAKAIAGKGCRDMGVSANPKALRALTGAGICS